MGRLSISLAGVRIRPSVDLSGPVIPLCEIKGIAYIGTGENVLCFVRLAIQRHGDGQWIVTETTSHQRVSPDTAITAGMSKEGGEGSRLTREGDDGAHQPSRIAYPAGKACATYRAWHRPNQPRRASNSSSGTVAKPVAASLIP
jgi:hypothetical protein